MSTIKTGAKLGAKGTLEVNCQQSQVEAHMGLIDTEIFRLIDAIDQLESKLSAVLSIPTSEPGDLTKAAEGDLVPLAVTLKSFARRIESCKFSIYGITERVEL